MKSTITLFFVLLLSSLNIVSAQITLTHKKKTLELTVINLYGIELNNAILTLASNRSGLVKNKRPDQQVITISSWESISIVGQSFVVKTNTLYSANELAHMNPDQRSLVLGDTTFIFALADIKGVQTRPTNTNTPQDGISDIVMILGGTALVITGINEIIKHNNSGYAAIGVGGVLITLPFIMLKLSSRTKLDYYAIKPSQWTLKPSPWTIKQQRE